LLKYESLSTHTSQRGPVWFSLQYRPVEESLRALVSRFVAIFVPMQIVSLLQEYNVEVSLVLRQYPGCIPRLYKVVLTSHAVELAGQVSQYAKGFSNMVASFAAMSFKKNPLSQTGHSLLPVILFNRYGQSMQAANPTLSAYVPLLQGVH